MAFPHSFYTAKEVAVILRMAKPDAVYTLIERGLLAAVNVAAGSGRPTWRITEAAITAFIEARRHRPVAGARTPRTRANGRNVTKYF